MLKNTGFWIVSFAIIVNFLFGFKFNFYRFAWFDTSLHFLGGLGVYFIVSQYFKKDLAHLSWLRRTIILTGISVLVGVIWEFAEYSATAVPAILSLPWDGLSFIGDLPDTLQDLSLDMLGALFGAILHFFGQRQAK